MSNATATIQPNTVLRGHSCAVQCVSFHQEEPLLASGDSEGLIKLWDLQTMRPVLSKRLLPQSQGVLRVACGDGWLLAQARDGLVSIWDVESKAVVSATPSFDVHTGYYGFCRVSYTENLRLAIPGDATGSIELWDGKKNAKIGSLAPKEEDKLGMSMAVKIRDDGNSLTVVAGYENGSVAAWDLRNPCTPLCSQALFPEPILALDCSPDFQDAAAGGANTNLLTMSLKLAEATIKVRKSVEIANEGLGALKVRSDGKILATGGWDGRIRIWKWKKCTPLATLKYHTKEVADLDFDTRGDLRLVSSSRDNTLCLWTVYPPSQQ